ncbi:MAG: Rrf2 family transcriptional regulator [Planctomycetes bacterium]|nr:Rrf2 family transcriptional regulator [Planctomycetota bacterium]
MAISKRCEYALRAIFELGVRNTGIPVKIQTIAQAQSIPTRFLEAILNELKHAGFVASKRGNDGGYYLVRQIEALKVSEVMEAIQGSIAVGPETSHHETYCRGDRAFEAFWANVNHTISDVCGSMTFAQLKQAESKTTEQIQHYCI